MEIKPSNISKILVQASGILPPKSAAIVSAPHLVTKVPESLSLQQIPSDVLRANFAPNIEDALPRVRKHFAKVYAGLVGKVDFEGVKEYKALKSMFINSFLRNGEDSLRQVYFADASESFADSYISHINNFITGIDSIMAKSKLPESIVVHRGISSRTADRIMQSGGIFEDKGFLSVSYSQISASRFGSINMIKLKVPKGTNAIDMETILPHVGFGDTEDELLLDRNSKLLMESIEDVEDDRCIFHMRLLSGKDTRKIS